MIGHAVKGLLSSGEIEDTCLGSHRDRERERRDEREQLDLIPGASQNRRREETCDIRTGLGLS